MAIFRLEIKASSKNAGAHQNYISATGKYEGKSDCVFVEDLNMPSCTGSEFWKTCEKAERKNANLYKEFTLTLPRELSFEQNLELARSFQREHMPSNPTTLAIHEGSSQDNPHAHVMFSMRENDQVQRDELAQFFKRANKAKPQLGGAPKVDKWKGKERLLELRKSWEGMVNQALADAGIDQQVSCLSRKAQGLEGPAAPKKGAAALAIEARGEVSTRLQAIEAFESNAKNKIVYKRQEALARDPARLDALIVELKQVQTLKSQLQSLSRPTKPAKLTLSKVMGGMEYYSKLETGYPAFKQAKQLLDVQYDIAQEASWFNPINKLKQMLEYNKLVDEFQPIKQAWKEGKAELQAKVAQTNKSRSMKHTAALKAYEQKREQLLERVSKLELEIKQDFGSLDKAEHLARQRHADLEPQRRLEAEQQRQRALEQQKQQQAKQALREALERKLEQGSSFDLSM